MVFRRLLWLFLSLKILAIQLSEHHLTETHHAILKETRQHKAVCLHATMRLHDIDHEERQSQHDAGLNTTEKIGCHCINFCSTIQHVEGANLVTLSLCLPDTSPLRLSNYKNPGASFTGSRPPKMIRSATLC